MFTVQPHYYQRPEGRPGETPEATWQRLYPQSHEARERAYRAAQLTLPEVYPEDAYNPDSASSQTAYQSLGAVGLSNFVNKLAVALFRPSTNFFRLEASREAIAKHLEENPDMSEAAITASLAQWEHEAAQDWAARGEYDTLITALTHIAVCGHTCLLYDKELDKLRVIPFRQYVLERSPDGRMNYLVICTPVRYADLSDEARGYCQKPGVTDDTIHTVYTRYRRTGKKSYVCETSVEGGPVIRTKNYTDSTLPVALPYWKLNPGGSYGISMVDTLAGDLMAYNVIHRSLITGSVSLTNWRVLVNPGGQTNIDDFTESNPGDAVPGVPGDIALSVTGDPQILEYLQHLSQTYEKRLARAFLLDAEAMRQGERVTAEEVRRTLTSLESQYAGMYSALAYHLQLPLARWVLDMAGLKLDKTLQVSISTGFDALSRANDVENLLGALTTMAQISQIPQQLQDRLDWRALTIHVGMGFNIDLQKYFKPEHVYQQEVQEQQEQMMAMQMMQMAEQQQPSEAQ